MKGILRSSQASQSLYQLNVDSQPTTTPEPYGSIRWNSFSGSRVLKFLWSSFLPFWSITQAYMLLASMSRFIPIIFVLSMACGCQSLNHRADPAWLKDFARTDTIELRTKNQTQRISDAETINRLQQIYANANWQAYWHTLPASIVERTIHLYDDDEKTRRLCYGHLLWELDASDDVRTATLSDDDRAWLDGLFDPLSTGADGG